MIHNTLFHSSSSSSLRWHAKAITLALLTVAVSAQQQQYDCQAGCSLDSNLMGPPVCGEDALTYLNECLAVCQNVVVVQYGSCENSIAEETAMSTDSEVVTMQIMARFVSRGYRFIAKNTNFADGPDATEYTLPTSIRQERAAVTVTTNTNTQNMEPYYVLFTPDGYEYAYRGESIPSYPGPTAPSTGSNHHQRHLAVIGTDTRTTITDTTAFPYRTIGEADFSNQQGGCTLTMISRNAALTAGHCVYNVKTKAAMSLTQIAPGRYRDSSTGKVISPFGTWNVETMQTFGEYKTAGDMLYDMAVVTFAARSDSDCDFVYPGDVVGYVGIDRARTSSGQVSDSRLEAATIIGYPADRPDGIMATSGKCSKAWESDNTQFAYHYCDTYGGNSGSAVLTSANLVLGEHAYGFYDDSNVGQYNGAVMMSGQLFDSVYEWAGLGLEQTVCGIVTGPAPNPDCNCIDIEDRPFFQIICYLLNRQACFGVS